MRILSNDCKIDGVYADELPSFIKLKKMCDVRQVMCGVGYKQAWEKLFDICTEIQLTILNEYLDPIERTRFMLIMAGIDENKVNFIIDSYKKMETGEKICLN